MGGLSKSPHNVRTVERCLLSSQILEQAAEKGEHQNVYLHSVGRLPRQSPGIATAEGAAVGGDEEDVEVRVVSMSENVRGVEVPPSNQDVAQRVEMRVILLDVNHEDSGAQGRSLEAIVI